MYAIRSYYATCAVKVTGVTEDTSTSKTYMKISFEDDESGYYIFNGGTCDNANTAKVEENPTDGTKALKVTTTNNADTWQNFSRIGFNSPADMTDVPVKIDFVNPNDFELSNMVLTINSGADQRSFYFAIPAASGGVNGTYTLDLESVTADRPFTDGTVNASTIQYFTLWYGNAAMPADTAYYVDNIVIGTPPAATTDFPSISFEDGETFNSNCSGNGLATSSEFTKDGTLDEAVTKGDKACKITVSEKSGVDGSSSTYDITPDDIWNIGDGNILHVDVTNPNAFPIQFRANVRDNTGAFRITSYNVCYTKLLRYLP